MVELSTGNRLSCGFTTSSSECWSPSSTPQPTLQAHGLELSCRFLSPWLRSNVVLLSDYLPAPRPLPPSRSEKNAESVRPKDLVHGSNSWSYLRLPCHYSWVPAHVQGSQSEYYAPDVCIMAGCSVRTFVHYLGLDFDPRLLSPLPAPPCCLFQREWGRGGLECSFI